MGFSLIAAADSKMGIGKNGRLPWRLPKDLKYFHDTTIGGGKNAVIMGRTTWESIPESHRPLPQRLNIVLSRSGGSKASQFGLGRSQNLSLPAGAKFATSLDEALSLAEKAKCEKIFVIGGAKVFAEAIAHPSCKEIFLTEIEGEFECDTFFPQIDLGTFKKTSQPEAEQENSISFRFNMYKKSSAIRVRDKTP